MGSWRQWSCCCGELDMHGPVRQLLRMIINITVIKSYQVLSMAILACTHSRHVHATTAQPLFAQCLSPFGLTSASTMLPCFP
jgi:hypothetical protein